MFQLLTIEDTVILAPQELDDVEKSLYDRLAVRYQDKVIPGEGPCLSLQNLNVVDKVVIHSEGDVQAVCQFDCLVFKPKIGSVLRGTLLS